MNERRRRAFRLGHDAERLSEAVDEEVRFHLEKKVERLVREGLSEEEAWAEARARFGDVERVKKRMTREGEATMGKTISWDTLRQDMHFAVRQLLKNPGFSAVTALTLALGIGATTAIFSVVDGILFRPLPFPEPDELVSVWQDLSRAGGPTDEWMNFPTFFDIQEQTSTLETVGAWDGTGLTLTGLGEPEQVIAGTVSHEMISDVLGVDPVLGRGFTEDDDVPGAEAVVLLTDGFWRRAFGGDPGVLGTTISLNDEPNTIIGVLPAGFEPPFMPNADLWTTIRVDRAQNYCGRGGACMRVVARRADGASLAQARAEAGEIARRLEAEYPAGHTNVGLTLIPMRENMTADARTGLLVLLSAVGFVLLIACVNVANLLLARATTRGGELAVRSALGAGQARLTAQLLTESSLLALVGGGAGLLLAYLGTDLLVAIAPAGTPRIEGVAVNGRVLGFAMGVTVLAGLLFGVAPALRSARRDLNSDLRTGGRDGSTGLKGTRGRGALVSGQVALALVLLVGAGLLIRSFQNLASQDLGFRADGVLTVQLGLPGSRYPDSDARRAFVRNLETRLAALPGVESVGTTSWLPLTGFGSDTGFLIEGREPPPPGQGQSVWFRRITAGYPEAMGLRLVSGRWITEADDENAPRVVVINDGFAERHFPGEDPLGQRINIGSRENPVWREIVGVAVEARYFGIRDGSRDALYFPFHQAPSSFVFTTVRSTRDLSTLGGEARAAVSALDPSLAVAQLQTMDAIVQQSLGSERFVTLLTTLFAGVAMLLAVVGLYGVVSYGVSQRLREMGVRLALGAEGGDVGGLVLRQSLWLVAIGLGVGVLGGLVLTRLMENLLFGVSATDPWTYGVVALALTAVATGASALPARRAARVDPIRVLKAE